MKFYLDSKFKKLQKAWYKKLQKAGFDDHELMWRNSATLSIRKWYKRPKTVIPEVERLYANLRYAAENYPFENKYDRAVITYYSSGMTLREVGKALSSQGFRRCVSHVTVHYALKRLAPSINAWLRSQEELLESEPETVLEAFRNARIDREQ